LHDFGPAQQLWGYPVDIPAVASCLPGVEEVHPREAGVYEGIVSIQLGMVKLRLAGQITVESMDADRRSATMTVRAADARVSGLIQGRLATNLEQISERETKLVVNSDINLFRKIREFGQPMIKKKADQMMGKFASNVADMVSPDSARKKARVGSILGLSDNSS
jgi:carbon-monoxide dehydrogenase small subunit